MLPRVTLVAGALMLGLGCQLASCGHDAVEAAAPVRYPAPGHERDVDVLVEPWGLHSLRIRLALSSGAAPPAVRRSGLPGALDEDPPRRGPDAGSELRPSGADEGLVAGRGGSASSGNIRADVSPSGGFEVTRLSDGAVLVDAEPPRLSACEAAEGCTQKLSMTMSSPPEQWLLGAGQHMNTQGVPGRLPPKELGRGELLPGLDLKGGRWDFESCTVYGQSYGAEICVPWVVAATPPQLHDQCSVLYGMDQRGGLPLSHSGETAFHATEQGCCSWCALTDACDLWVHQPSLNRCWLLRIPSGGGNVTTYATPDRSIGFKVGAPPRGAAISSGGYDFGFLWNMPNFGGMDFQSSRTVWTAHDPKNLQLDMFVTTYGAGVHRGTPDAARDILRHYVDATGHAPVLPDWATGYWHSPMGAPDYSQEDVVEAAAGLHARNLSTSLFVIDYFNWAHTGDYTFNPEKWPDPKNMSDYLSSLGTRLMVSAWPFVNREGSRASAAAVEHGYVVRDDAGEPVLWPDAVCDRLCHLYDPTNPAARRFLFDQLETGYLRYGVRSFWFDASEPENVANFTTSGHAFQNPLGQPQGSRYHLGTNQQVGMMFPWFHAKMAFDGLTSRFPNEAPVTLSRSGWAGTQRFGAAHWNGDLEATWTNLKKTVITGQNAQLSGFAWWTHDIGAINGCNISDAGYQELLVRWFQLGVVTPIFRNHGSRPVEPWKLQGFGSSGEEAYRAIVRMMHLREEMRPYVKELMSEAAASGTPANRPLSWDFPADPEAWFVTGQLMFGPRFMFAPVTDPGVRELSVYFPHGGACIVWRHYLRPSETYDAGSHAKVRVPLDEPAIFECVSDQNAVIAV